MTRSQEPLLLLRIFVSPFHNPANSYTRRQIEDFEVLGLGVGTIREALIGVWGVPRSAKLLVLNWFEDRLATARVPAIEFIRSLLVLCLLKMRVGHIVWVRHNHRPHAGAGGALQRFFLAAIGRLVSVSVSHRAVDRIDSLVVPHPLYGSLATADIARSAERDIRFLIPGSVRANKGILDLLQLWPSRLPLHIAGHCNNPDLTARIMEKVSTRGLNVRWDNRFLDEAELDALIARSRFVLLTNQDDTMIVSGIFYHAASLGANVLIRPGRYGDAMRAKHDFVQLLDPERLADLTSIAPAQVMDEIESSHGRPARLAAWTKVFARLNVTTLNGGARG